MHSLALPPNDSHDLVVVVGDRINCRLQHRGALW
jgi:hypothetical protein